MMRLRVLVGIVGIAAAIQEGRAAVSAEEAKQLGSTLTEFGAEKAGNSDGSIPEYTGGLTKPPPAHKPGGGRYANPFADEKPLFSIDRTNMARHEDKLTEGAKELLRRYSTFRIDVYPTHRSVAYPKHILERCAKNAVSATLTATGNGVAGNPYACVPFPIPKSGLEVLWNHMLRNFPGGQGNDAHIQVWYVDAAGHQIDEGTMYSPGYNAYTDPTQTALKDSYTLHTGADFTGPAAQAGEKQLLKYSMDYDKAPMRAWIFTPGQRRVRLAPEFAYDTPVASVGGVQFYDEIYLFAGKPDRFNWKLLGKKEMYVPYNNFEMAFWVEPRKTLKPNHNDPAHVRWEKHRVWVVEATLKDGARHAHKRRLFYADEDTWMFMAFDGFDGGGKLHHIGFTFLTPIVDLQSFCTPYSVYDLARGGYMTAHLYGGDRSFYRPRVQSAKLYTPERLGSQGIR